MARQIKRRDPTRPGFCYLHQIRYLIGTLRLEGILDDTIIMFTADHGDMLGNHGMAAKRIFYESSANISMIMMPNKGNPRVAEGTIDNRLVRFADVMPTLLDLVGIAPPETVDGISMVGEARHAQIYGECGATTRNGRTSGTLATGIRTRRWCRHSDFWTTAAMSRSTPPIAAIGPRALRPSTGPAGIYPTTCKAFRRGRYIPSMRSAARVMPSMPCAPISTSRSAP